MKNEEKRRGNDNRQHTTGQCHQEANFRPCHQENFRPCLKRRAGARFTANYCTSWFRFTTTYTTSEFCVLNGIVSVCLHQHCSCLPKIKLLSPHTHAAAVREHTTPSVLWPAIQQCLNMSNAAGSLFTFFISPESVERIALKTRTESIAGTSVSRRI